jgi:branched-subunit amino acid transport protein
MTIGEQDRVLLTIVGMGFVTYVPRLIPLLVLTRPTRSSGDDGAASQSLPAWFTRWLGYVPVSVLAAMLLPSLLVIEGRAHLAWGNLYLWAALPTAWVAWRTHSLVAAVLTGVAVVALGRALM